jgi:hypothetical protein
VKVTGNTEKSGLPTTYSPIPDPGVTVSYTVRPGRCLCWSNTVQIAWSKEEEPPELTWRGYTAFNPMPAGVVPFTAEAFINQRVPANPTVLSNSKAMVELVGQPQDLWTDGGYDHPWYYAKESDPLYEITSVASGGTWANGLKIRIPAVAKAAPGTDGHMGVVEKNGEMVRLSHSSRLISCVPREPNPHRPK